jgi:hypothetical protein
MTLEGVGSLLCPTTPYQRILKDGLVVKSVADERDAERVAELNGVIHGPGVAAMARELILHHPDTRPEHWLYVEDRNTSQVVSTLCLIPWTWRYEDVELRAGEVGLVGTLESYRHRGLVRALFARHAELLQEGNYDLSHIQGIPYFYRQFGYAYALPLEGGWRVEPHLVPRAMEHRPKDDSPKASYQFRQASIDDLPTLMRLYDKAATDLSIHTVRDEGTWRYLLGPSTRTDMTAETWLILDADQQPVGYLRVPEHGFGEGLNVGEVSCLSAEAALAALQHLRAMAIERKKPYIRLNVPAKSTLVQTARHLGAHDTSTYAWQIRLPDFGRLLHKLAPILERRVAASPYAGLTRKLCFNLYRVAFEINFQEGKLVDVQALGFCDRGEIRVPPLLAAPLLLGWRSREELRFVRPDLSVSREWQYLVDILFPKVDSFIYTIY